LTVSGPDLLPLPNLVVFSTLLEISVCANTVFDGLFYDFPSSGVTPVLRTFGVASIDGDACVAILRSDSLSSLDVLELDMVGDVSVALPELSASTLVVIDVNLDSPTCLRRFPNGSALPRAFRLCLVDHNCFDLPGDTVVLLFTMKTLATLTQLLDDLPSSPSSTSLRFLSLPHLFRQQTDLSRALGDLISACEAKGVEVFYDPASDWEAESLVSPSLWRRARELKQEQAAMSSV
jgi:hypothetical protein